MPRSARPPRWPVDGEPARGRARPRSSPPASRWSAAEELQVERSGASAHLALFLLTWRSRTQDSRRRVWPTGGGPASRRPGSRRDTRTSRGCSRATPLLMTAVLLHPVTSLPAGDHLTACDNCRPFVPLWCARDRSDRSKRTSARRQRCNCDGAQPFLRAASRITHPQEESMRTLRISSMTFTLSLMLTSSAALAQGIVHHVSVGGHD